MEWTDDAILLGARRHGETSLIVEAMTRGHGRHLGLVRGGRSARQAAVLQAGNSVTLTWRARLDEHLGLYAVEPVTLRAGLLLQDALSLHALNHAAALLRLLPERDPHEGLHAALAVLLDHLDGPEVACALMARFELAILSELGFGLDLSACALTGATQALAYVSPRSGRAVSAQAGEPWRDRLLRLPAFIRPDFGGDGAGVEDIRAAFALTGHFLDRDIWQPRGLGRPPEREAFLEAMRKALGR